MTTSTSRLVLPVIATKIFTNSDGEELYVEQTFMSFDKANAWVCETLDESHPNRPNFIQTDFIIEQTFIVEVSR